MYIGIANRIFSPFGLSVFSPDQVASLALWLDASQNVFTGGARQFTAANSEYFDLGDKTVFEVGDVDAWWAGWVYFDSLTVTRAIFSKYNSTTAREWIVFYDSGTSRLKFNATGDGTTVTSVEATTFGAPPTARWLFLFAYHDATNNQVAISVNGGAFDTASFSGGIFTGTSKAAVGASFSTDTAGNFMDGRLSRLAMGKSPTGGIAALATTIRDSLYNNAQGKTYAELTASEITDWGVVWYANCNEESGNLIDNHSTNDGTDTNTVTSANGPASAIAEDDSGNNLHGILTNYTDAQLVESWRADAGQLILDQTANKNHASPINLNTIDAYSTDRPSVFSSGYSLRLNSTQSEYLSIFPNTLAPLLSGASSSTVSAWVKHDGTIASGSVQVILRASLSTVSAITFYLYNDAGTVKLRCGGRSQSTDTFQFATSTDGITANTWTHVAGKMDYASDTIELFIDGVSQGATAVTFGANTYTHTTATPVDTIGWQVSGTEYFSGSLFDVRLYASGLSSANITNLAGGGDVSGAAGRWNFSEGPGSGYSLLFDGSDDYVQLPAEATLAGATVATFAGWVKFSSYASAHQPYMESTSTGTNARFAVGVTTGGLVSCSIRDAAADPAGSATNITGSLAIALGGWAHIAFVFDSVNDSHKIYVNGKIDTTNTTALGALGSSTAAVIQIGRFSSTVNRVLGRMDGLRTYATALTADQIMQLAEGSEPIGATGLKGQWDFDDGPFSEPGDGEPILGWQDQKAGKLFQQSTSTKRPTYTLQDADFNSNPSITFDGTDDLLTLADAYLFDTAGTVMIVFKQVTTGDAEDFFASADDATTTKNLAIGQRTAAYGITQNDAGTADTVYGGTTPDTTTHLLTVSTSGTAYTVRLDGVAESLTAGSGTDSGDWFGDTSARDNMTIGARKTSSETNQANVKIAEIQVYSAQLTGTDLTNAEAYLIEKYAI